MAHKTLTISEEAYDALAELEKAALEVRHTPGTD